MKNKTELLQVLEPQLTTIELLRKVSLSDVSYHPLITCSSANTRLILHLTETESVKEYML